MKFVGCRLAGLVTIEPRVFQDVRGFFLECWNAVTFAEGGIDAEFVQDNHSRSHAGVLRGLHFQDPGAQGKLVRVVSGAIFDVAVDLRRDSPTFGEWMGIELSAANKRMIWVPRGFAHGFLALENDTDVHYKCDAPYAPQAEHSLAWNDPDLAIKWPIGNLDVRLSPKDSTGISLREVEPLS